ncbi:hypothetical protein MMB17_04940 [Methylobacterium organophilum]|uniref:hypothetical protein n=1 Tax=Methylobacterium organophilum TaxID=410 RepID=UPI001F13A110|nr:hypothetical protein [Methylobacterium organophilum]UMY18676.1 hypothetical protein MMB17_04940 [Methylobacterium organophilum]
MRARAVPQEAARRLPAINCAGPWDLGPRHAPKRRLTPGKSQTVSLEKLKDAADKHTVIADAMPKPKAGSFTLENEFLANLAKAQKASESPEGGEEDD